MKSEFDKAAEGHVKMTKYEKDPYMYIWYFKSEEEAKPLEGLLEQWEEEYA